MDFQSHSDINRAQNFDFQSAIQGVDPSSGNVFSGLYLNETNINSGGIGIWSFGGSVYISEYFLIGGSVDFWNGHSRNELDATATDTLKVDSELARFRFDDEIDREYTGVSGRVGILANLSDVVSLGVTFVAPTELGVDELWREYTVALFDDGEELTEPESGNTTYHIERPYEIGTGIALKLFEKQLILATDIQFTDWRQTRYDPNPAEDISNNHFEEYYSTTIQVRLGVEYQIPMIDSYVRVGYFRDTIPFTETEIENDRDYLTVGAGKIFEDSVKLDVAYMWGNWQQYRNDVTTQRNSHRIFVSCAYRY